MNHNPCSHVTFLNICSLDEKRFFQQITLSVWGPSDVAFFSPAICDILACRKMIAYTRVTAH